MAITTVFDPPQPSDSPAVFDTKAFTLLGDLNTWSTEANAVQSDVNAKQSTASAAADTASTQAGIATTKASEATSGANTATTQAGIATTKASEASASASSAASSAASAASSAASIDPATLVKLTGDQTIAGTKTFSSAPVVPGINGGQLAGMRNKVIGHFAENQRGLTSVADDAYCCDRWYVLTETGNVTVAQVTDPEPGAPFGWKLTQPDATAKRMGLATIIESNNIRAYRSTAMNLGMRVKPSFAGNVRYAIIEHTGTADVVTSDVVNNWASATFTAGNFFIAGLNILKTGTVTPGAATYGEISDWVALGASTNNVILFFWTESTVAQNGTVEFNRPQFEPGVVKTPHEFRFNELALCQRYTYGLSNYGANTAALGNGQATSSTQALITVSFPVLMRSAPTLTATAANTFSVGDSGGTPINCSSIALANAGQRAAILNMGVSSGLTSGQGSILRSASGQNPLALFVSEL